jgi:Pyruvate/2-oxoacid:ferredoxin oxidoreductase gamma subunit
MGGGTGVDLAAEVNGINANVKGLEAFLRRPYGPCC